MTSAQASPHSDRPVDVMLYVQHLLGIGHIRRAAVLSKVMSEKGLRVLFVSGGCPVPDLDYGAVEFIQLPPIKSADESFALLNEEGQPIDDSFKAARRERLLELYRRYRPKALLIELFPFGRRQVRFELLPLLEAACHDEPRPKILCSLRDILTRQKSSEKARWMIDCFNRYFDQAIVHGDPNFVQLTESFSAAREIGHRLCYSGFVVDLPVLDHLPEPSGEVIVSAGGGAVAGPLLEASLAARPLSVLSAAPWRFLIGHNYPQSDFHNFAAKAPKGVIVERARPDFHRLLTAGQLSISQGGYNTVMELMALQVPAVVVPYAAGAESEQSMRCHRLAERRLLTMVEERNLSPASLAKAIETCLATVRNAGSSRPSLMWDGAAKTAEILKRLIAEPLSARPSS